MCPWKCLLITNCSCSMGHCTSEEPETHHCDSLKEKSPPWSPAFEYCLGGLGGTALLEKLRYCRWPLGLKRLNHFQFSLPASGLWFKV